MFKSLQFRNFSSKSNATNVDALHSMTIEELDSLRKKNLIVFHVILTAVLLTFTQSMFTGNFILAFLAVGTIITGYSAFENYQTVSSVLAYKK
jgi:hypothetical protein